MRASGTTRTSKVIDAEGEYQAAEKFLQAAQILAEKPQAMQLRYLTTLHAIASERSSTIVFPLPIELMKAFAPPAKEEKPAA
jgi:regulator of protease activity HflC (stomatin/prohibitin superfamily)